MIDEEIGLNHQDELTQRFKEMGVGFSEFSFPNVYLFKKKYQFVLRRGKSLYIVGTHPNGRKFLMPTEKPNTEHADELLSEMAKVDYLYPIPKKWSPLFPDTQFSAEAFKGDSDYVFMRTKLAEYPGRKLSGKRNLLKQFQNNYQVIRAKISAQNIEDCKKVLDEWVSEHEGDSDKDACLKALEKWGDIHCMEGYLYYIEGKPAAFMIGSALTKHSFVIFFLKGLREYKGIYQFLYHDCANSLPPEMAYINLEQDLGKPELEKAKKSYQPDCMCDKFHIELLTELKNSILNGNITADSLNLFHNKELPVLSGHCENC